MNTNTRKKSFNPFHVQRILDVFADREFWSGAWILDESRWLVQYLSIYSVEQDVYFEIRREYDFHCSETVMFLATYSNTSISQKIAL